jgi:hypothetical protein
MNTNALAGALRNWDRNLDCAAASDQPQRRGPAVAQDCIGPARKHGGHPPAVLGEQPVTDRVDAAVDGAEQPAFHSMLNRPGSQPKL